MVNLQDQSQRRDLSLWLPVDAAIEADIVEDIVCCIAVKLVEDCSSVVCELISELNIADDDAWCCCCCCGDAGSSVNRNAISRSRNTSVSLDSIKLKRLKEREKLRM